jgi:hypothetical protein
MEELNFTLETTTRRVIKLEHTQKGVTHGSTIELSVVPMNDGGAVIST